MKEKLQHVANLWIKYEILITTNWTRITSWYHSTSLYSYSTCSSSCDL